MASIKIPQTHVPSLESLIDLSQDNIKKIYDFLKDQPDGIGFYKFIESFEKRIGDKKLAAAIYSFGQLLEYKDVTPESISSDIVDSMSELVDGGLDDEQKGILRDRVFNILSFSKFLVVSNKAQKLIEDMNATVDTNISTDVRILFNESDFTRRTALLLHKLSIRFKSKNGNKDDFDLNTFHLDNNDLIELKSQIESALTEEENIRTLNKDIFYFIEL